MGVQIGPEYAQRHDGRDTEILAHREKVYKAAKARNPQRWSGNIRNWEHESIVYLNPTQDNKGQMAA